MPDKDRPTLPQFIQEFYPDYEKAYRAFCGVTEGRYNQEAAQAPCDNCNTYSQLNIVRLTWKARHLQGQNKRGRVFYLLFSILQGKEEAQEYTFDTYHCLCDRCFRNQRWRFFGISLAQKFFFLFLGLMRLALGILFVWLPLSLTQPDYTLWDQIGIGFLTLAVFVIFVGCFWVMNWMEHAKVPPLLPELKDGTLSLKYQVRVSRLP